MSSSPSPNGAPQPLIQKTRAGDDLYEDGDYRRGSKKKTNVLLVRPMVGKVKTTTYDLPPSHFAFGKRDVMDEEGVREVVHSWAEHKAAPEPLPGRDFVRLNRSAASLGCTTAKDVASYRRDNDVRLQPQLTATSDGRSLSVEPSLDGTTFGKPSKPSTPVGNVLANMYQRTWIQEQRDQARKDAAKQSTRTAARVSKAKNAAVHTRASLGHKKVEAAPPPPPFKLQRFTEIPSRVKLPKGTKGESVTAKQSQALKQRLTASLSSPTSFPPVASASPPSIPSPQQAPNGHHQHHDDDKIPTGTEVYTQEQLAHVA